MEFYVQKSDVLKDLDLAQGAVERKSTIPILSHVLLEAADFNLRISATDLELGVRSSCPAKVKTPGAATVRARRLVEIVRSLPDSEVRFKGLENHGLQVTCERASFKLVGLEKDNFPALPSVAKAQAELPAAVVRRFLEKTRFAASAERVSVHLKRSSAAGEVRRSQNGGHGRAPAGVGRACGNDRRTRH